MQLVDSILPNRLWVVRRFTFQKCRLELDGVAGTLRCSNGKKTPPPGVRFDLHEPKGSDPRLDLHRLESRRTPEIDCLLPIFHGVAGIDSLSETVRCQLCTHEGLRLFQVSGMFKVTLVHT